MNSSVEASIHRVPSLVEYCQRVAITNIDSIPSFGSALRFEVVKPVLDQCDATTLQRLEDATPSFKTGTQDIWQALCLRTYPLAAEQLKQSEPACWRIQFFMLREAEARRLEEVGFKMRKQRLEAEDRKKEREVKITDRLPPMKRSRPWGLSPQPKTLFQKTKSEASKLQRSMYTMRTIPPMSTGKSYHIVPPGSKSRLLPAPSSQVSSRVTVTTVRHIRPPPSSAALPSNARQNDDTSCPALIKSSPCPPPCTPSSPQKSPLISAGISQAVPTPSSPRIKTPAKRDPSSALFMPKHRAYSQRTK